MENYFFLTAKNSEQLASAFAPENTKLAIDLIEDLKNCNQLPFEFELFKLGYNKNGLTRTNDLSSLKEIWLDYQPNSLAWPLFSIKLKNIIEKSLTGKEGIDWISAKINSETKQFEYFIPRFKKMLDVLDFEKTSYVPKTDKIIKPVFSLNKIIKYSMFHQPERYNLWEITSSIFVNEALKKNIQNLKGIKLEKVTIF